MQRDTGVLLELLTDLVRDLGDYEGLSVVWQVQFVDKLLCELVGCRQSFVQVPEERVLQPVRGSNIGLLVGGQVFVDTKLSRVGRCWQRCVRTEGLDVHVYSNRYQRDRQD